MTRRTCVPADRPLSAGQGWKPVKRRRRAIRRGQGGRAGPRGGGSGGRGGAAGRGGAGAVVAERGAVEAAALLRRALGAQRRAGLAMPPARRSVCAPRCAAGRAGARPRPCALAGGRGPGGAGTGPALWRPRSSLPSPWCAEPARRRSPGGAGCPCGRGRGAGTFPARPRCCSWAPGLCSASATQPLLPRWLSRLRTSSLSSLSGSRMNCWNVPGSLCIY